MKDKIHKRRDLEKLKLELTVRGVVVSILSIVGLLVFSLGFTLIHPTIYMLGIIIGTGWFLTGITD